MSKKFFTIQGPLDIRPGNLIRKLVGILIKLGVIWTGQ